MKGAEGFPPAVNDSEGDQVESVEMVRNPEFTVETVGARVERLVDALNETLDYYENVRLPDGRVLKAEGEHEQMLAKAQECLAGLEGEQESLLAQLETHNNRCVRQEKEALELIELFRGLAQSLVGYMSGRTDLVNRYGNQQVIESLSKLEHQFLSTESANGSENDQHTSQKAA